MRVTDRKSQAYKPLDPEQDTLDFLASNEEKVCVMVMPTTYEGIFNINHFKTMLNQWFTIY